MSATEEIQDSPLINIARLETMVPASFDKQGPSFNSEENYKKLSSAYTGAKTQEAYNDSIRAVYTFVDQHPEDMHSVDLLKHVAILYPVWEADVNIPLFYKIACTQKHPKIYEALVVLWCCSDEYERRFKDKYDRNSENYIEHKAIVIQQLTGISKNKDHPRQKDAKEFLDAIGKDWDDT